MLSLTRDEAAEPRDALEQLLGAFDEPGWHAHVSSADYTLEITPTPSREG